MKDFVLVKGITVTQRQLSAGTHLVPQTTLVLEAAVPAAALAFAAAAAAPGSAAATPTGLSHGALHEIQQQCCCNGQRYLRVKHIPGIQQSPTT